MVVCDMWRTLLLRRRGGATSAGTPSRSWPASSP